MKIYIYIYSKLSQTVFIYSHDELDRDDTRTPCKYIFLSDGLNTRIDKIHLKRRFYSNMWFDAYSSLGSQHAESNIQNLILVLCYIIYINNYAF